MDGRKIYLMPEYMIKPHLTKWGDTGTESHKSVKHKTSER